MKILHVSPSYYPATYWGGPIFSVNALNIALAKFEEIEITVLTTDSAGPSVSERLPLESSYSINDNIKIIYSRRIWGASTSLDLLMSLPSLIKTSDIVHLTGTYSFPTLPTLFICRLFRKPIVWSPRGAMLDSDIWSGSKKIFLKKIWNKFCYHLVGKKLVIHTTSKAEYHSAKKNFPDTNICIIPNSVNAPSVQKYFNKISLDSILNIMYIGRLSEKKGIERLIESIKLFQTKNVHLNIYGNGDLEYKNRLKGLVKNYELECSITFHGQVDGEAKENAFLNNDICVAPSYTENFCMSIAEALSYGLPVIASKGTPWELVKVFNCGMWVDNDPKTLYNSIRLLSSLNLSIMGNNGRKWIESDFSDQKIAHKMIESYSFLLQKK